MRSARQRPSLDQAVHRETWVNYNIFHPPPSPCIRSKFITTCNLKLATHRQPATPTSVNGLLHRLQLDWHARMKLGELPRLSTYLWSC